jgi:hypothetical protein
MISRYFLVQLLLPCVAVAQSAVTSPICFKLTDSFGNPTQHIVEIKNLSSSRVDFSIDSQPFEASGYRETNTFFNSADCEFEVSSNWPSNFTFINLMLQGQIVDTCTDMLLKYSDKVSNPFKPVIELKNDTMGEYGMIRTSCY